MLSSPLRGRLPEHATMIATDVTATFMAPFKLNFYVAFIIAMPFILYQIWQFLAPALYKTEKKNRITYFIFKYRIILCRDCLCLFHHLTRSPNILYAGIT